MPYALLDEDFHSNPKMLAVGNDGVGLYARALSYCAHYQTDGFVPHSWAKGAGTKTQIDKLVTHGVWMTLHKGAAYETTDRTGNRIAVTAGRERGYVITDFLDYNPSSREREQASEKKSAAGKEGAKRRWGRGSRHSTSHNNAIADAMADGMAEPMANGWQSDGSPRARPPSPTPTPEDQVPVVGEGSTVAVNTARENGNRTSNELTPVELEARRHLIATSLREAS